MVLSIFSPVFAFGVDFFARSLVAAFSASFADGADVFDTVAPDFFAAALAFAAALLSAFTLSA